MSEPIQIEVMGPDGKTPFKTTLPDGYMASAAVEKDYIPRSAHNSEFAKFRSKSQDDLLTNDEFRTKALEAWGINLQALEDLKSAPGRKKEAETELIAQLRGKLEKEEITPLREQLTAAEGVIAHARQSQMERVVMDAALNVGVDPAMLKATTAGGVPPIVNFFAGSIAWDEETGQPYACDPTNDEFRISPKQRGAGESHYMTVQELLEDWAKDPANVRFITNGKQRGANFNKGADNGGQKGGTIDGSDPREVGRNLEAIAAGRMKVHVPGVSNQ